MGIQKEAIKAVEGLDDKEIDSELESIAESDLPKVAFTALMALETRKSRPPAENGKFQIPNLRKGMPRPDNFGNLKPVRERVVAR